MKLYEDPIGFNPYEHLQFLVENRDRTKILRSIIEEVVKPGMSVLDVGTGALGILAIMAAKAGATRVVGVDIEQVEIPRRIAKQNNVSVDFIQSNINSVNLNNEKFDVILGMIYLYEPWLNENQRDTFRKCVKRFGHDSTILVPNAISNIAVGYGFDFNDQPDTSFNILLAELDSGVDLTYIKNIDNPYFRKFLFASPMDRYKTRTNYIPMSNPVGLALTDYTSSEFESRPETIQLNITKPGFLTSIQWNTEILYNEIYIRSFTSPIQIRNPKHVEIGDQITIRIPKDAQVWSASNGMVEIV